MTPQRPNDEKEMNHEFMFRYHCKPLFEKLEGGMERILFALYGDPTTDGMIERLRRLESDVNLLQNKNQNNNKKKEEIQRTWREALIRLAVDFLKMAIIFISGAVFMRFVDIITKIQQQGQ